MAPIPPRKLPTVKLVESLAWQKHILAEWLREWELNLLLRKSAEDTEKSTASTLNQEAFVKIPSDLVLPYDRAPIKPGQIRLFAPRALPDIERPIYFAVLSNPKAGSCLIAPFSPFSVPAVPSELMTGRKEPFLRVLCLWNWQTGRTALVGKSWIVDELGSSLLWQAWDVYQDYAAGLGLRSWRRTNLSVGPPLLHPLDPRHEYIQETNLDAAFMAASRSESSMKKK